MMQALRVLGLVVAMTLSVATIAIAADPIWDTCQGDPFCELPGGS